MEVGGERNGGIRIERFRGVLGTVYPPPNRCKYADMHRLAEHRAWS